MPDNGAMLHVIVQIFCQLGVAVVERLVEKFSRYKIVLWQHSGGVPTSQVIESPIKTDWTLVICGASSIGVQG